jgi:hypothetical protein
VGIPGKASVQTKMGVSRRASRSSRSIAVRRYVYSSGNASLTRHEAGCQRGDETEYGIRITDDGKGCHWIDAGRGRRLERKEGEKTRTDGQEDLVHGVVLEESERRQVLPTNRAPLRVVQRPAEAFQAERLERSAT